MHFLAVLVTSNSRLIEAVERKQPDLQAAVLQSARVDAVRDLTLAAFNPDRSSETFVDFLGGAVGLVDNRPIGGTYQGVVILFDQRASSSIAAVRDGIFAGAFDGRAYIENERNFLTRLFGRLVRNLSILIDALHDKTRMEAAILPARNFDSAVFRQFLALCQESAGAADFQNLVVPALTAVARLRGPKRRSKYPMKYFRDDRPACFQYGHEKHSSFDTGGDHSAACTIRGSFRLGVPLEQQRHFNVTAIDDSAFISGDYSTCHLECVSVSQRTHLNMFSNDFHK